jgi:hypothetical protein
LLNELFIANIVKWHQKEDEAEQLGCGVVRLRTADFFAKIGYEPLAWKGEAQAAFPQQSPCGFSVVLMHLRAYSAFATAVAKSYRSLWDERLEIDNYLR